MVDAHYTTPRLAAIYDAENDQTNSPNPEIAWYGELAGPAPLRVLDLGCGTGRLAVAFAERGHAVTGVDPAAAMLAVARARPGGDRVTWIEGDVSVLTEGQTFDLAVMTGHVFQVFLSDDDVQTMLRAVRERLSPEGRVAFETRNPAARAWEGWTPERTRRRFKVEQGEEVEISYHLIGLRGPYVDFEGHNRFFSDGAVLISRSTLRFMGQQEVAAHLAAAGFGEVAWYGDWDGRPYEPESREIIAVARRS